MVRRATIQTLSKIESAKSLIKTALTDSDPRVKSAALKSLKGRLLSDNNEDPLPLNASIAHSLEFGDGVSNILLQADAFTGTNWNCDEEDFAEEIAEIAIKGYRNVEEEKEWNIPH